MALIRMCCVCHRVEQEGGWRQVSELSVDAVVSHGYCPDCFAEVMMEIRAAIGNRVVQTLRPVHDPGWSRLAGRRTPCV